MKSPEEVIRLELTREELDVIARGFGSIITERSSHAKNWTPQDVEYLEKQLDIIDSIISKFPDFENKRLILGILDVQKLIVRNLKKQKNI